MKNAVATLALLLTLALAGCAGAQPSPAPTGSAVASPSTSASPVPTLDCPAPAAGASKLKVIGQLVRLRTEPESLAAGVVVIGKIPFGEVVELREIRSGNWRKFACGQLEGWVLMHNGKDGAERRFRLEPVS